MSSYQIKSFEEGEIVLTTPLVDPDEFITTWSTTAGETITLPLFVISDGTIDWG